MSAQIFSYIGMFMVICILSGLNLISVQTLNAWLFDNTIRSIISMPICRKIHTFNI